MKVNVIGGEISEKEKELYIKHVTCRATQPKYTGVVVEADEIGILMPYGS